MLEAANDPIISLSATVMPLRFSGPPDPHRPPPLPAAARRDMLGAFASLLLLTPAEAGASKAHELDRELLACCAEAQAIDARADAITDTVATLPSTDPKWSEALGSAVEMMPSFHDAVERAAVLPARTPEGLRAKAGLVLSYLQDADDAGIALSLARDVMGRA